MLSFELKERYSAGSDCMAEYDGILNKPLTVKEFIDAVLTEHKNDWGAVQVNYSRNAWYRHGKLENKMPKKYLKLNVVSFNAIGGWSRMDYRLTCAE